MGTMMGRFLVNRDNSIIRDVGDARVVFDEAYVAPLFVAHLEHGDGILVDSEIPSCNMNRCGSQRIGKAQIVIKKSGERVWLPPESVKGSHYRNQKRRAVAKERERVRRHAREAKVSAVVGVA